MTNSLQRAIAEIEKLPADQQDVIAECILADLNDEQAWSARFESTTGEQWSRLAEVVRQDIAAGDTEPLDDVFPPDKSQQ